MQTRKIIFICRYADEALIREGVAEPSHSLTRKTEGICSVLEQLDVTPIIVAMRLRSKNTTAARIMRVKNRIVYVPSSGPRWLTPAGQYIYAMCSAAAIICRILKTHDAKMLLWDILPDSIMPALLSGASFRSKIILDVEEFIHLDPDAPRLFKWFELAMNRVLRFNYITSSFDLGSNALGLTSDLVIPGFSTVDSSEDTVSRNLRWRSLMSNENGAQIKVLYSGRLDFSRGLEEFLRLAEAAQGREKFRFLITGFGTPQNLRSLENRVRDLSNVWLLGDLPRSRYMQTLCTADVGFSYLVDEKFRQASFPSKLVEYRSWLPITLSNINFSGDLPGRIILLDSLDDREKGAETLATIERDIEHAREEYKIKMDQVNPFSIKSFSELNKERILEIFG